MSRLNYRTSTQKTVSAFLTELSQSLLRKKNIVLCIIINYILHDKRNLTLSFCQSSCIKWAPSIEFVSSSIPSWQILIAHAQPFKGARDLAFGLKVPLDSLLVWASSRGSGETARMRRLAWTFAVRLGDKYQIRLTRSKWNHSRFIFPVPKIELW